MATPLYLRTTLSDIGTGNNDVKFDGNNSTWSSETLALTRGAALQAYSTSTVAGTTNGVEVVNPSSVTTQWVSPPVAADVTISGSITWNLWASEAAMTANVAINGALYVLDGVDGQTLTLIDKTARSTEVALTTRAVNNFAETPAAGVLVKRGDRLVVRIFGDDGGGTMASGSSFSFSYNGGTAAADGDSYCSVNETVTFESEPAGSQIFLTNSAASASLDTASVDRDAWTSRGAGVQNDVLNITDGWNPPIQYTDTAGGTVVDWFTRTLNAFTLGGAVRCNIRALESNLSANASVRVEVAIVASDGSSPTAWAAGTVQAEMTTSEAAYSFLIAGDDVSVSQGQRLRIRLMLDDASTVGPRTSGVGTYTSTVYYAGAAGATGDTYLTFPQTMTEGSPPVGGDEFPYAGGGYYP